MYLAKNARHETKNIYQSVQNAKRKEKVSEMQKQQEQGVGGTLADFKL